MANTQQTVIRAILIAYLALLVVALLTGNALASLALNVGFGAVAIYFGYTVYEAPGSIDRRVRLATAASFVLAGLSQFAAIATQIPLAEIGSSVFFVIGFIGYIIVRRGQRTS
jgi:hypothetical protein